MTLWKQQSEGTAFDKFLMNLDVLNEAPLMTKLKKLLLPDVADKQKGKWLLNFVFFDEVNRLQWDVIM
jgi:hypothetical protein